MYEGRLTSQCRYACRVYTIGFSATILLLCLYFGLHEFAPAAAAAKLSAAAASDEEGDEEEEEAAQPPAKKAKPSSSVAVSAEFNL